MNTKKSYHPSVKILILEYGKILYDNEQIKSVFSPLKKTHSPKFFFMSQCG